MSGTTTVSSSYVAAFLATRGHEYRPVQKQHPGRRDDCIFVFRSSKRLEADIRIFEQDVDLAEFVLAHRQLKLEVKEAVRAAREKRAGGNRT